MQIDGVLVPKENVREREVAVDSGALWGDRSYAGLRATDGTPIDTRTKHREYMKKNNLTTVDDFKDHFEREERRRISFQQGEDAERRADIVRALTGGRRS